MKTGSRILAALVVLALFATGPLAPLAAAQQPTPTTPETPPAQPMPPAQTMPPAQPAPEPVVEQPQYIPEQDSRLAESAAYNVGAGVANVFYIPGKALLCGLGGAVGIFILFVSIGSAPRTAAYFAREGCGGKWILTGDDIRPEPEVRFDWERDGRY